MFGVETKIKWVNDVFINEQKVAGVLSNAMTVNNQAAVTLGIGINLNSWPQNVLNATSVQKLVGKKVEIMPVLEQLSSCLFENWQTLNSRDFIASGLQIQIEQKLQFLN